MILLKKHIVYVVLAVICIIANLMKYLFGKSSDVIAPIVNLKQGNIEFMNSFGFFSSPAHVQKTKPHTIVFACSDMRAPVETLFNCSKGDIYLVRELGLYARDNTLESLEYAISDLKIKQLIILGHTECDTIKHVLQNRDNPATANITKYIKYNLENDVDDLCDACRRHTGMTLLRIINQSEVIREQIKNNNLKVYNCMYHTKTGEVVFNLDQTYKYKFLLNTLEK